MISVTIDNEIREYPEGTAWLEIAQDYQHLYEDDILLVQVNGKLQELHKHVKECQLRFVTAREKPGMSAYQRSATLLMLKAFYSVVGAENLEKIVVDFSVGKGVFVEPRGNVTVTPELLARVKEKMHEYVARKIPIMKRSVSTEDAIDLFTPTKCMIRPGFSATAWFPG